MLDDDDAYWRSKRMSNRTLFLILFLAFCVVTGFLAGLGAELSREQAVKPACCQEKP